MSSLDDLRKTASRILDSFPEELGRRGDRSPLGPIRVERRGQALDTGVLGESGQDALFPGGVDHRPAAIFMTRAARWAVGTTVIRRPAAR